MNEKYLSYIKERLKSNYDVNYREIQSNQGVIYIIFIDNMVDSKFISEYIIAPIINKRFIERNIEYIKKEVLVANSIGNINNEDEALLHILSGDVVIFFSFLEEIIYCEAKGFSRRSIQIPITEGGIKVPREGFVEAIKDNISMIRRKIKTGNFKLENFKLGNKTQTTVVMCYIEESASKKLIDYIRGKIQDINTEYVIDSNYIEEQLKCKNTIFDTIGYTEKPDVAVLKLLQGKIIILVDGSPFAVTAPFFFYENFHVSDDYGYNKYFVNLTRALRWVAFLLAVLLPGFYIALVTYHFSLIPSVFVIRLAISRAGVPFPTVIEVYLMMFFFQVIREAGVRLPQPIGQAMSIVGALILGDAAVGSGLAAQSTLIVVALSSICSFLVPKLYGGIFIWAAFLVLIASLLGLPGFYLGFCVFIAHLAGRNTCGYPYLFPIGTSTKFDNSDQVLRDDLNGISNSIFGGDGKR